MCDKLGSSHGACTGRHLAGKYSEQLCYKLCVFAKIEQEKSYSIDKPGSGFAASSALSQESSRESLLDCAYNGAHPAGGMYMYIEKKDKSTLYLVYSKGEIYGNVSN